MSYVTTTTQSYCEGRHQAEAADVVDVYKEAVLKPIWDVDLVIIVIRMIFNQLCLYL
jgi:hypothetical protein